MFNLPLKKVLVTNRSFDHWNASLPQEFKQEMPQPGQAVNDVQAINGNGGNVSIRHFCRAFQGQLPLCPFLDKTGHHVCYLVQFLINLEVEMKPDIEQFNWSVSPMSNGSIQIIIILNFGSIPVILVETTFQCLIGA